MHRRLVDPTVLTELQAELGGDQAIISTFIRNYAELLPWRVERLHHALEKLDIEDAMDAVLSLKTSSHMVGAICMSRLATELEISIRLLPGPATWTSSARWSTKSSTSFQQRSGSWKPPHSRKIFTLSGEPLCVG